MEWLFFAFALELGAIRGNDIPVDVASYVETSATITIVEHLKIEGALRSYQYPEFATQWMPFRMDYRVGLSVEFGALSFGVEHECYHPVSSNSVYSWQSGGWEKVFLRIVTPRTRS